MVTFLTSKVLTSRRPKQFELTGLATRALEPLAANTLSELRYSHRDSEACEDPRSRGLDHFAIFNKFSRVPRLLDAECLVELSWKIIHFLPAVYLPFALPCMYLNCLNRRPLPCMLLELRLRADSNPTLSAITFVNGVPDSLAFRPTA
jgi:hypothetical protein